VFKYLFSFFLSQSDVFCLFSLGVVGHCYVWSHTTKHPSLSVGLIRTRDRPAAETSNWQDIESHAPGGIRTHNPSKRAAADPRLTPRGHRHWLCLNIIMDKYRDFLCNTTVHFYCNTATCCGLLQKHHQVIEVSLCGDNTRYSERGVHVNSKFDQSKMKSGIYSEERE